MEIDDSNRQCRCKYWPMWDLRQEKFAFVRFSMSVVFISYIIVDYFWKIN